MNNLFNNGQCNREEPHCTLGVDGVNCEPYQIRGGGSYENLLGTNCYYDKLSFIANQLEKKSHNKAIKSTQIAKLLNFAPATYFVQLLDS